MSGDAKKLIYGDVARVAIALDATGSMAGLIASAKNSISEIVKRTTREAGRPIEIELFIYRDYDVPRQVLERSGRSSDPRPLIDWLARVTATGGGGNDGEAVEAALQAIVEDGSFAVVLLAGDEPSNSAANLASAGQRNARSAHDLARELGSRQVPIHSFVVGNDSRTQGDFSALSKATGGKTGRLDGSAEMIDLAVMAILSRLKGSEGVRRYIATAQLTDNSRAFAQLLLGKSE
ncbi:MAG: hypothetical protein QOH04_2755 [Sphingomonadales bacterium]|nr:hypothetical protein [Sphingomonadales bacterium]